MAWILKTSRQREIRKKRNSQVTAVSAQGVTVGEADETCESFPDETAKAIKSRTMSMPSAPSRQEVLEHNVTHCPFRAWCPWCVQGKCKATPHLSSGGPSEQGHVPLVAFDYCFMSDKGKISEREDAQEDEQVK